MSRILEVLEELSVAATPLANHELASRLGVPVASMHRLLRKLHTLGYVEKSGSHASYSVGARLAELGERLADAGGRAPPLRRLMTSLQSETGHTITVWVPSGVQVRMAARIDGRVRGPTSTAPGNMAALLSTPGLAIASQWSRDEVNALITQCRRRGIALGRSFDSRDDVEKALRAIRQRGFVSGYNLHADGWGMLAFPITITHDPPRPGALVIGSHAPDIRQNEERFVHIAREAIARYAQDQAEPGKSGRR